MDQDDQNITDETTDTDQATENQNPEDTLLLEDNQATALVSLEELIKNHIDSIDKLRDEVKKLKEQFEDTFSNNLTYKEHTDRVKDAAKARSQVRMQIAKQPSITQLDQKIKDLRFDLSEQAKTLSDLLQDYKEQTGATQIETHNGQLMEIVSELKLVRKNTKYNP